MKQFNTEKCSLAFSVMRKRKKGEGKEEEGEGREGGKEGGRRP